MATVRANGWRYEFCESPEGGHHRILYPPGANEAIGLELAKQLCCAVRVTFPLEAGWRIWQAVADKWLEAGFRRTPLRA